MPLTTGGKDATENTPLPRRTGQRVTYGAVPALQIEPPSTRGSGSVTPRPFAGFAAEEYDDGLDDEDEAQLRSLSWTVLKWVYMLVPLATLVFFAGLVALVTWGWPPSREERKAGQTYPHPFYWKAFSIGVFASITVQALRVPTFVATSSLRISPGSAVVLSTIISTALNEALRLLSVPLTTPSPTSGFHSSFWLGLGWGTAETVWGIVQGYEQLALYQDVIGDAAPQECGACAWDADPDLEDETYDEFPDSPVAEEDVLLEEEELERRVEVLENMRARRELEDVMGVPFPLIPLPLHILWRIDTLLLNLGLTLILSAFYFDSAPLYRHHPRPAVGEAGVGGVDSAWFNFGGIARSWPPASPRPEPSRWLPLAWALVTLLHIALNLTWKVVGRVGVGAVTWAGLIVALGSVFAGLGAWGGLV